MQRIMKNPDEIVDDMLRGFLKAHSGLVEKTSNPRVVKAKNIQPGKVGVVTGGGSGHKPAFIGYVGRNLCDAAAVGGDLYLSHGGSVPGRIPGGGSGQGGCLPVWELFRRQHERENGREDGTQGGD